MLLPKNAHEPKPPGGVEGPCSGINKSFDNIEMVERGWKIASGRRGQGRVERRVNLRYVHSTEACGI
jgi:hypothetical protein